MKTRLRADRFVRSALVLVLVSQVLFSSSAFAVSDTYFYKISDSWNERFRYLGEKEVVKKEQGFLGENGQPEKTKQLKSTAAKYFAEDQKKEAAASTPFPPPPPINVNYTELKQSAQRNIEMYDKQVLVVQGRGIERYIATDAGVVEFYQQDAATLQIRAIDVGQTFVHIWDEEGRSTFRIRVTRAPYVPTELDKKFAEQLEGSKTFKMQYSLSRSSFYEGNDFRDLGERSLNMDQYVDLTGDTPYGEFSSAFIFRRIETVGNAEPVHGDLHLRNADIGPFRNFDLSVGDDKLKDNLIYLPNLNLRGVNIVYHDPDKRVGYTAFYGRELPSVIGTLAGTNSNKAVDSFVGGGIYDYKLSEVADWKLAYAQAYGQGRPEELSNKGAEFVQTYKLGPDVQLKSDTAYDNQFWAATVGTEVKMDKILLRNEYRNIAKEFFTVIGNPSFQGEEGMRTNAIFKPQSDVEITYDSDMFLDRLFPFPGEKNHYNLDQSAEFAWYITPRTSIRTEFDNKDETQRISPLRDRLAALGYYTTFDFWTHSVSIFSRFQDRNFESLSNPALNYRQDGLNLGLSTLLFWDIAFAFTQEVNYLEATTLNQITHPHASTYSLSRTTHIGDTPFTLDWTVRYRDEEQTESERSFLTGEDRLELSGGLRYTLDNMEFFVDGHYDIIHGERLLTEPNRAEAEVNTGVRYLWDTGLRWEPSGSFEGYVFEDTNNDGVRQPGENGIPNMTIIAGTVHAVTDSTGHYHTPSVTGKRTTVTLSDADIPVGFAPTTPFHRPVTIRQQAAQRIDFGLVAKSFVFGYVFNDQNHNGRYDPEDRGVTGVRVRLDDKVQVTDTRGSYRFVDAAAGAHKIELDLTTLPQGFLPQTAIRKDIEVFKMVNYQLDFPMSSEKSLSGRIFLDTNKNGNFDADERGVAGALVRFGEQSATSDKDGYYLIEAVAPGTHTLVIDPASIPAKHSTYKEDISFEDEPGSQQRNIPVLDGDEAAR